MSSLSGFAANPCHEGHRATFKITNDPKGVIAILRRLLLASITVFYATSAGFAADPPDAEKLREALEASRHPIRLADGRLAGPGDQHASAAQSARHVLVGEDHGLAELPTFTEALFRTLHPMGFETYVTGVSPPAPAQAPFDPIVSQERAAEVKRWLGSRCLMTAYEWMMASRRRN